METVSAALEIAKWDMPRIQNEGIGYLQNVMTDKMTYMMLHHKICFVHM